jgi:hypothetical protein
MSLKISVTSMNTAGQQVRILFNVIPTGNYVTGGDTLDFSQMVQDPAFQGIFGNIPSSQPAQQIDVWGQNGDLGNHYYPVVGSLQTNNKLKIDSAFNTELSAAAYPAPVLADKIVGEAIFAKLL